MLLAKTGAAKPNGIGFDAVSQKFVPLIERSGMPVTVGDGQNEQLNTAQTGLLHGGSDQCLVQVMAVKISSSGYPNTRRAR